MPEGAKTTGGAGKNKGMKRSTWMGGRTRGETGGQDPECLVAVVTG